VALQELFSARDEVNQKREGPGVGYTGDMIKPELPIRER